MTFQWKNDKTVQTRDLPTSCSVFSNKFDSIQTQLRTTSCMDELLSALESQCKHAFLFRVLPFLFSLFHMVTLLINYTDCYRTYRYAQQIEGPDLKSCRVLHVLFPIDTPMAIPCVIGTDAVFIKHLAILWI